jgi:hypothetical protein
MAVTLPKIAPEASSWTQKMRLGILYNLCAKSGAKQIFRRSYGDLATLGDTTELNQNAPKSGTAEKRPRDTPTGAIACLFLSQYAKCPS